MNETQQVFLEGLGHIKAIAVEMSKLKISMIADKTSPIIATIDELLKRVKELTDEVDILDALDALVGSLRGNDSETGVVFYLHPDDLPLYQRAYQLLRENGRKP